MTCDLVTNCLPMHAITPPNVLKQRTLVATDAVLTDVFGPLTEFHTGKAAPLARPLFATMVEIVQVVLVAVGFYLEGIEIIDGVFHLSKIAQGPQGVPEIEGIEAEPRVARRLCLAQVNHLVVLECAELAVEMVGHGLLAGKDMAKHGHGGKAFAPPQTAHLGRHVAN